MTFITKTIIATANKLRDKNGKIDLDKLLEASEKFKNICIQVKADIKNGKIKI